MERIFITENERKILLAYLHCSSPEEHILQNMTKEIRRLSMDGLVRKGLMSGIDSEDMGYFMCHVTDYGKEYLNFNPFLENPKSEKEAEAKNDNKKWKDRIFTALITILFAEGTRLLIDYFRYE